MIVLGRHCQLVGSVNSAFLRQEDGFLGQPWLNIKFSASLGYTILSGKQTTSTCGENGKDRQMPSFLPPLSVCSAPVLTSVPVFLTKAFENTPTSQAPSPVPGASHHR